MTWLEDGGSSTNVTPDGFECNGWDARLYSTTIPSWMQSAGSTLAMRASIALVPYRPVTSYSDVLLYLGANPTTLSTDAKVSLRTFTTSLTSASSAKLYVQVKTAQSRPLFVAPWRYEMTVSEILTDGETDSICKAFVWVDETTFYYSTSSNGAVIATIHKVDATTNTILGSIDMPGRAAYTMAMDSSGDVWILDNINDTVLLLDWAQSFSTGTAVVDVEWDLSAIPAATGMSFITVGGTEYVVLCEWQTSGTVYVYVVDASLMTMTGSPTFSVDDRYKRFTHGIFECVGLVITPSGDMIMSNNDSGTSAFLHTHYDFAAQVASAADDSALTLSTRSSPCDGTQDLDVHPTSGRLYGFSKGHFTARDYDGWTGGVWSRLDETDNVQSELTWNDVSVYYNAGQYDIGLNGSAFLSITETATATVSHVFVGGPNIAPSVWNVGYAQGFIKNVLIKDSAITPTEEAHAASGAYESRQLTTYEITLTNSGFENAISTEWTIEAGALGRRTANPPPYEGTYYVYGGASANSIASQRIDLVSQTGLSAASIDAAAAAGTIWTKLRHVVASWDGSNDPCAMGIRNLNGVPTEIDVQYHGILSDAVPISQCWYKTAFGHDIAVGTRYVDALMRMVRTGGTNNDGYIDYIRMYVYKK